MLHPVVAEVLMFGFLGLGMECAFTAIPTVSWGEKTTFEIEVKEHLFGYSSLFYFPLYCLAPVGFHYADAYGFFAEHWFFRGVTYALIVFIVEFIAMWILRLVFKQSPSEESYKKSRWNIDGLIRIDYAPCWFGLGLFFEWLWRLWQV